RRVAEHQRRGDRDGVVGDHLGSAAGLRKLSHNPADRRHGYGPFSPVIDGRVYRNCPGDLEHSDPDLAAVRHHRGARGRVPDRAPWRVACADGWSSEAMTEDSAARDARLISSAMKIRYNPMVAAAGSGPWVIDTNGRKY